MVAKTRRAFLGLRIHVVASYAIVGVAACSPSNSRDSNGMDGGSFGVDVFRDAADSSDGTVKDVHANDGGAVHQSPHASLDDAGSQMRRDPKPKPRPRADYDSGSDAGTLGADMRDAASPIDRDAAAVDAKPADAAADASPFQPSPIPNDLWKPDPGALPATGNYVYIEDDPPGSSYAFTQANSLISVSATAKNIGFQIEGDASLSAYFSAPNSLDHLIAGYYPEAWFPADATQPGIDVMGWFSTCGPPNSGWFAIDQITIDGGVLVAIDVRFENYCGSGGALRGALHFHVGDTTAPPGPTAIPGGLWQPPPGTVPATGNFVYLNSDSGDYIGQGQVWPYTLANATIQVFQSGGLLDVEVDDGQVTWSGNFVAMLGVDPTAVGYYGGLRRWPFHNPVKGGLDWSGDGRGCNELNGWFAVDDISFDGTTLTGLELRFEQHCEGMSPALHGLIRWRANDVSAPPPGPTSPPKWTDAPAGTTPASGNYVYLASSQDDSIGQGIIKTYSLANAQIDVTSSGGTVTVTVQGDHTWIGKFGAMQGFSPLAVGYYEHATKDGITGTLDWSRDGHACPALSGRFAVDDITYDSNGITAVDLWFEQGCDLGDSVYAPLAGNVHWVAGDATVPPMPGTIPPDAWKPAPDATPASGNYVYIQTNGGDYFAGLTYTNANALLGPAESSGQLSFDVRGDLTWYGDFVAMQGIVPLLPGYYSAQAYGFNDPAHAGLDWRGDGMTNMYGCPNLTGWFAIDDITYEHGSWMTAIDLRFEQYCSGPYAGLHGQIHWRADDPTPLPAPIDPPPAGLWQPALGATPANGHYVYLESVAGDPIGNGQTLTYSDGITLGGANADVQIGVAGWFGEFVGMGSLGQLKPGYYGDLKRYPGNNPAKGGMNWRGGINGDCGALTGWFVVDAIAYDGTTPTSLDLRFEQHCYGTEAALHGAIHYAAP